MLSIRYVNGDVAAFQVGNDLWYLCMGPGSPTIYDAELKRQIIPNVDKWFQAKTGHRYSYASVCDMAISFAAGVSCSYQAEDIMQYCAATCTITVDSIFKTTMAEEYRRMFWIEMMDPVKISAYAHKLRDNLDVLREKHGEDVLFNYLCRLWRVCGYQSPNDAPIFERLVERLNLKPHDPDYPDITKLNTALIDHVVGNILSKRLPQHKNIPVEIIKGVNDIKTRKL